MSRQHPDADRSLVALLADPGLRVERAHDLGPEGDEHESLVSWQARALAADPLLLARLAKPAPPVEVPVTKHGDQALLPCAAYSDVSLGGRKIGRFLCSRPGGHPGPHESCEDATVLMTWPQR